jgi:putative ABC transport system permease protein
MRWRRRRSREDDLDRELRSHLELEAEEQEDDGLSPEEARHAAKRALGNIDVLKEEVREVWGSAWFDRFGQDIVYALRTFRRAPGLTSVVILTLALGIGATTAVFSVVDAVLLRALPYPDSDRLVVLRTANRETIGEDRGRVSAAELRDWQTSSKSFEAIAGYQWITVDLLDPDQSERLQGLSVTPDFFNVFGIRASVGRLFNADEALSFSSPGNVRASAAAIVFGRGLWERRFALDPSIVGRNIPLGICCPQQPRTINVPVVGAVASDAVFPPTFPSLRDQGHGLNDLIDYWMPLDVQHAARSSPRNLQAVARLKPGVTIAQAQTEMNLIARSLEEAYPNTNRGWTVEVVPIKEELFTSLRPILFLFMGAAAFVLLIACSNVAVLLTFNAIGRLHEFAVRAALGAGGGRLVRQFVTETLLLSLCGGSAGLLVAMAVKRTLISFAPPNLPRLNQASLNLPTLSFTIAATLVCGLAVGLIPALRIVKFDLESILRSENSRNATSHARARTYEPLLVLQVALTVVLMIGSGLMFKSLDRLLAVTPGFRTTNLLTTTLSLPTAKHAWSYNATFGQQIVDRIKSLPGVENAAYIRGVPMSADEPRFQGRYWPSEKPVADSSKELEVRLRVVSPGYFETMGIPVDGRDFTLVDDVGEKIGGGHRLIINDALARLFWPGQRAVGKTVNRCCEVIGVVGNVRYSGMDSDPIPEVYLPAGLYPQDAFSIVVRTSSDDPSMTQSIRAAVHNVERDVFISQFQTMNEVISNSMSRRRFVTLLLSAFSATGLALAMVGIAGIVAYSLSMRLGEIGIRIAMGASPNSVIALIARQGLVPALAGLVLGLPLAAALTGYLGQMLYRVSRYDLTVFAASIGALGLVSILAAGMSAYRCCHVDASTLLK